MIKNYDWKSKTLDELETQRGTAWLDVARCRRELAEVEDSYQLARVHCLLKESLADSPTKEKK